MRKIIVSNYVSLDGFIAGPNGEIDWFVWDEEMAKYSRNLLYSTDTLMFGRVTYELMAGYWPTASPPSEDQVIIDAMNNLPKIVFSRTLDKAGWTNATLVREIDKEHIMNMKQQPGMDMVIFGSGGIVSTFAQRGLIDEYRIIVNPVVLGSGKPLFKDIRERIKLKLLKTKTFRSNGNVVLYYGQAD